MLERTQDARRAAPFRCLPQVISLDDALDQMRRTRRAAAAAAAAAAAGGGPAESLSEEGRLEEAAVALWSAARALCCFF